MGSSPSSGKQALTLLSLAQQPYETSGRRDTSSACVELYDYGQSIFSIQVHDPDRRNLVSKDLLSGLARSFRTIREQAEAKVVLLTGEDRFFLSGGAAERKALIGEKTVCLGLDCDLPVIAVMKGDGTGMGWLMGSLCDFMVCGEESLYQYHNRGDRWQPSEEERAFFVERFGEEVGLALLSSEKPHTGKELKEKGVGLSILPRDEVDAWAMEIARELAGHPRESLVQLKRCLSEGIARRAEKLAYSGTPPVKAKGLADMHQKEDIKIYWFQPGGAGEPLPDPGGAEILDIGSDVVTVKAYKNGVVLVTLCDEKNKNTFSDAFLRGVRKAFEHIRERTEYKAVVLTGYDHYFCCGGTREGLLAIQEGRTQFTDLNIYGLPLEGDRSCRGSPIWRWQERL